MTGDVLTTLLRTGLIAAALAALVMMGGIRAAHAGDCMSKSEATSSGHYAKWRPGAGGRHCWYVAEHRRGARRHRATGYARGGAAATNDRIASAEGAPTSGAPDGGSAPAAGYPGGHTAGHQPAAVADDPAAQPLTVPVMLGDEPLPARAIDIITRTTTAVAWPEAPAPKEERAPTFDDRFTCPPGHTCTVADSAAEIGRAQIVAAAWGPPSAKLAVLAALAAAMVAAAWRSWAIIRAARKRCRDWDTHVEPEPAAGPNARWRINPWPPYAAVRLPDADGPAGDGDEPGLPKWLRRDNTRSAGSLDGDDAACMSVLSALAAGGHAPRRRDDAMPAAPTAANPPDESTFRATPPPPRPPRENVLDLRIATRADAQKKSVARGPAVVVDATGWPPPANRRPTSRASGPSGRGPGAAA